MIRFLALVLCFQSISCATLKTKTEVVGPFDIDNLVPWSIVAFDSMERGPSERVKMIQDLGFSQYAFGGRQKHVDLLPEEIEIAKRNNVHITAVWLYLNYNKDQVGNLREQNEQVLKAIANSGIHPEIWIGFHPKYFEGLTHEESYEKGLEMISYITNRAASLGCKVGLYNHGGWMGDPYNQLDIIHDLNRSNLGIVYNFHHGHQDIDRYQKLFPLILPHLLCVNLNGMEKGGKKILPIGAGTYERAMIKKLQTLGYEGPWGILGHVKGGDAKKILRSNLIGLQNLDQPTFTNDRPKRVFLFAGQSNMDGRADANDLEPVDLQRLRNIQNRVLLHHNHKEALPLQPIIPNKYIQNKFGLSQCFGPELFFGLEMAESSPRDSFIFIKRAKGGTSLHGCWNPYWTIDKARMMEEEKQPKLFFDFIQYTQSILSNYRPQDYHIEGLLWVQGEDDSNKRLGPIPSQQYYTNLKNLITETRKQLNTPDLPLYIFQVGNGKVIEGMKKLSREDANVYFIPQSKDKNSPDYYERNPPPIGHYNARSMKKIGLSFFQAQNAARGHLNHD